MFGPLLSRLHAALGAIRAVGAVVRALLITGLAGGSLLLLAWLTLCWGILPHPDLWRPRLEQWASTQWQAPVRVDALAVEMDGWHPRITLHQLRVGDGPAGEPALRLPQVRLWLSPRSLLRLAPVATRLEIDAPELALRRDTQGGWWLAGWRLPTAQAGAPADPGAAPSWWPAAQQLLAHGEIRLRAGRLHWLDERPVPPRAGVAPVAAAAVSLTAIELTLRRTLAGHQLRLEADPPAGWGQRLSLDAELTRPLLHRLRPWPEQWHARLSAHTPGLDAAAWHAGLPGLAALLPVAPPDGAQLQGDVSVSAELEAGRWQRFGLEARLQRLTLASLNVRRLEGHLSLERTSEDGWLLLARRLAFQTADGQRWPASQFQLRWHEQPRRLDLQASQLHLGLLAGLVRPWPALPTGARQWIDALRPQGHVQDLRFSWAEPAATAPQSAEPIPAAASATAARYQLSARISGLHLAPGAASAPGQPARPGVEGLDVNLQASERGGSAQLNLPDGGALSFPGVFDEARVPLQQLQARLSWQLRPRPGQPLPEIEVRARDLRFANADAQGQLDAIWRTGEDGAPSAAALPGRLWLEGRLLRGEAPRVHRYLPQALPTDVRQYLAEAVRAGRLEGVRFRVDGPLRQFPFADGSGDFRITGQLQDGVLAYVPATPPAPPPWPPLGELAAELSIERTRLDIRNAHARSGGLVLHDVSATIADLAHQPELEVQGSVHGPAAAGLAFVAASPVSGWMHHVLDEVQADGPLHLDLKLHLPLLALGQTRVDGLLHLGQPTQAGALRWRPGLPWLRQARGAVRFSERAFSVQAQGEALGGEQRLTVAQPEGQPLRISASGVLDARALPGTLAELPAAQAARWAPLVPLLNGRSTYQLDAQLHEPGWALRLASDLDGLGLNLPAPLDKPPAARWPLHVQINPLAPQADATPRAGLALSLAAPVAWQAQLALALPPQDTPRLLGGTLTVGATPEPDAPPAGSTADAAGLSARLRLPALDLQAWQQRLARLDSPSAHTSTGAPAPSSAPATGMPAWTAALPPLALRADVAQLHWGPRELGRLDAELDARPAARLWRLPRLRLDNPDARLDAQGRWTPAEGSELQLDLVLNDTGQALARAGLPDVMRGGQGRINARLHASVAPPALRPDRLDGRARVQLAGGQILKIDPGLARLLGVLNAESLPRRLTLDFRDLLGQGLAVDQITGDVVLAHGIARTSNLRLQSVQALALLDGQADLGLQTLDMNALIVPQLSAGTASLAYAAVNPAVGLGTYLAQRLLRPQLLQAGAMEYRLLGPWLELLIEPVQRSITEPLPAAALEEAPAATPP